MLLSHSIHFVKQTVSKAPLRLAWCIHQPLVDRSRRSYTTTPESASREAQVSAFASNPRRASFPIPNSEPKRVSMQEAVGCIKSGDTIFLQGAAATPLTAVKEITQQGIERQLKDIRVVHIHLEGELPYLQYPDIFRDISFFVASNVRDAVNDGRADYTPVFLSEVPKLFRNGVVPVDVAVVQVSPIDQHGFVSLGVSVDITLSALQCAKKVIGIVNKYMPRSHGDGMIHISHLDYLVQNDTPLIEFPSRKSDGAEDKISDIIANQLVENGSTLQMGIGSIPNAVLSKLKLHKDLGVHTEMFSDGLLDLVASGAITNAKKRIHPGKIISGFVMGSRKVYDFLHDNPMVMMQDISVVNNPSVIMQNPKVVAINSCIEVDLTGQVVSDTIGTRVFSGFGGQVDFIRGAALSDGGKPIIAIPSVTAKGVSKIVPRVSGGVVCSRGDVHWVVTEYGCVNLHGKSLRERAKLLISIAHPDHRAALEKAAFSSPITKNSTG